MQQIPFVDSCDDEESDVLGGLLKLQQVTSSQIIKTTQEVMIAQNEWKPRCEFDMLDDPDGKINEDRINSAITETTNKRWYGEFAKYFGVTFPT